MSEGNGVLNGVIEIGDEGMVPFKFGSAPEAPTIWIDVLRANDEWAELDWTFRDADGKVREGKGQEQRTASIEFVRNVVREWGSMQREEALQRVAEAVAGAINYAQACRFHAQVSKRCKELKPFFSADTGEGPSPQQPSGLTFSE